MFKFILDRSKWLCGDKSFEINKNGNNSLGSELWDPHKKRGCCLGNLALACGVSKNDLQDHGMPTEINIPNILKFLTLPGKLPGANREKDYAIVNDDKEISQKEREKRLKKLMKEDGIDIQFVGKLNP